ncbi:MAG: hypothetical protein ACI8S6_005594, partial [Myxococcota bacterium]
MCTSTRLLTLLLLGACQGDPDATRTAIQLELTAPDVDVPGDYLDVIYVVVDPETPFADADGEPLPAGEYGSRAVLVDFNTDDADLEMVISVSISAGATELPVIEIQPGSGEGSLDVSAYGYQGAYFTMQSAALTGLTFTSEEVTTVTLPLGLLDTFVGPCTNDLDDDSDGWTDADDPDCQSGDDEVGYGNTACNDGTDNDGDGDIDGDDVDCESASDDDEATGCTNDLDDDSDGWIDEEDPDCAAGDDEVGYGDTECNDSTDNDGDGDIDRDDRQCDGPTDDSEAAAPCEDELDNDSDGWTDLDDPDCDSGTDEVGHGTTECNDSAD